MPNRQIVETICTSRSLASLSDPAERLWYRLLTTCDNHGRFESDPELVRAKCYQRMLNRVSESDVAAWLDELQNSETVQFYEHDEKLYGFHPNWKKHNKLRTESSRYPDPPQRIIHVSMRKVMADRAEAEEASSRISEVDLSQLRKSSRSA